MVEHARMDLVQITSVFVPQVSSTEKLVHSYHLIMIQDSLEVVVNTKSTSVIPHPVSMGEDVWRHWIASTVSVLMVIISSLISVYPH